MNKAHVFQHNTTGVQIFVYHCKDEEQARLKFEGLVYGLRKEWTFIGLKTAHQ